MPKTIAEINEKIKKGQAVVATAEEIIGIAKKKGMGRAAEEVDVVTTGTFGPMCSSGAYINTGHSKPRIKLGGGKVYLNDVPVYTGLAAVDVFLGATALPDDDPKMATYKAKWDKKYRKKWGIKNEFAARIPGDVQEKIANVCKKAYRALNIIGYGRFDIRLTPDNDIYVLEANANPALASGEDFALSAEKGGILYESLIQKIINLAFKMEY